MYGERFEMDLFEADKEKLSDDPRVELGFYASFAGNLFADLNIERGYRMMDCLWPEIE